MRAGTITLRVGNVLVAIGGDGEAALQALRTRFGPWIDAGTLAGAPIAPAFDLRLATGADASTDGSTGTPRAVPQLRHGAALLARSRHAADVVDALDAVLGGVLARQASTGVRVFLRPFVAGDRMVLVDADAPTLVNDPRLTRAGIVELPAWSVAVVPPPVDGAAAVIEVAAPLSDPGSIRRYELAGIVGVLADPPAGDASLLAHYAARHTSPTWFTTVQALVEGHRLRIATNGADARHAITDLLA